MPGSLPVSTILFGLISAFLTIPGFHAAEPVPVPTEASGIPFIGETSPRFRPKRGELFLSKIQLCRRARRRNRSLFQQRRCQS